jgi:hypothetical protein
MGSVNTNFEQDSLVRVPDKTVRSRPTSARCQINTTGQVNSIIIIIDGERATKVLRPLRHGAPKNRGPRPPRALTS